MKLERLSATELGNLVNRKVVSPTEVINYFLDRIDRLNSELTAFTYVKPEDAISDAKRLEVRIMNGENVGPLAGVPVGLKDFLPSKRGWQNSHGGVECLIATDDADSEFYKAASKLGAIAIGKTNAPAFGFSGACGNKLYGSTKNPFNRNRTSGGSSGGTASAVAGGLILLGEGGDAGGSIRIPSGWCNLFGFKPSVGTVPSYCRPDGWSATHPYCFNGALTKTVEDSAIMLNTMARYDPRDPISLPINANKDFKELRYSSIRGKRIGVTSNFDLYPNVDPDVVKKVEDTAKSLEYLGAHVDRVPFNFKHSLHDILYCWAWSISVDTALDIQMWKDNGLDIIRDHADQLPEDFIIFNQIASQASIQDMRNFNEIRTDILDNFEDAFEKYDIIVSPTAICDPLPLSWNGYCKEVNGKEIDENLSFISFGETPLSNFVGYPAASIPAGFSSNNLPIGMQVIAKQYHDEDVFAIANAVETILPWRHKYPEL